MQIIYLYREDGTGACHWVVHHDAVIPNNPSYKALQSNWIVPGTVGVDD